MASQYLAALGIETEIIGAQEYTTHILGGDAGRFDLMVEESDFADAQAHLGRLSLSISSEDQDSPTSKVYFKRAILHSFLAIILLPVVFNYTSLKNLKRALDLETDKKRRLLMVVFVSLAQTPSILTFVVLIRTMNEIFSFYLL